MVTYMNAIQVVRNSCVKQQKKKVNPRALFLLVAVKTNFCWDINSLDYQTNKQKYTNTVHKTMQLNE